MKFVNTMFQVNNLLWYNLKSRWTFFQGREDGANIMMIVTYRATPCSFSFLESGVLQNKDDDKIDDIFIYHAHTFGLLYSLYLGYKSLK
jgi:hypothetical protein